MRINNQRRIYIHTIYIYINNDATDSRSEVHNLFEFLSLNFYWTTWLGAIKWSLHVNTAPHFLTGTQYMRIHILWLSMSHQWPAVSTLLTVLLNLFLHFILSVPGKKDKATARRWISLFEFFFFFFLWIWCFSECFHIRCTLLCLLTNVLAVSI